VCSALWIVCTYKVFQDPKYPTVDQHTILSWLYKWQLRSVLRLLVRITNKMDELIRILQNLVTPSTLKVRCQTFPVFWKQNELKFHLSLELESSFLFYVTVSLVTKRSAIISPRWILHHKLALAESFQGYLLTNQPSYLLVNCSWSFEGSIYLNWFDFF